MKLKRVGILYAMGIEAKPLLRSLETVEVKAPDEKLPFRFRHGTIGGLEVIVAATGRDTRYGNDNLGTDAAVLASYLLLDRFSPQLFFNAGTAGGFRAHGAKVGQVYLGEGEVCFHDRHTPVERYRDYCRGRFPVQPAAALATAVGLPRGRISTGNSLGYSPEDLAKMQELGTTLKDMEAASAAWVAWMKQVPFLPVKAVTDLVEDPDTPEQFLRNYELACGELALGMLDILRWIDGRTLEELQ